MHSNSEAQQSQCTGQNNAGKCMLIFMKGNYVNYTVASFVLIAVQFYNVPTPEQLGF